jgi:hypothetical protein
MAEDIVERLTAIVPKPHRPTFLTSEWERICDAASGPGRLAALQIVRLAADKMDATHVIAADAIAEITRQREEIGRLRETLTKAAEQFEFYAREHRERQRAGHFNKLHVTADAADEKAATNERLAAMCRAALPKEEADG